MSFIYPTVHFCCSNIFPEFLPVPDWKKRDRISEKLERKDMLRRRNVIDIPEFYVGKAMEVGAVCFFHLARIFAFPVN